MASGFAKISLEDIASMLFLLHSRWISINIRLQIKYNSNKIPAIEQYNQRAHYVERLVDGSIYLVSLTALHTWYDRAA